MKFRRITINPNQMGGVPCIRSLRIPVVFEETRIRIRSLPIGRNDG